MQATQAIIPNSRTRSRPYAWGMIAVNPDPPRVGAPASIGFPLTNPGPDELVVEQITVKVAHFGIGLEWEDVGTLGPIRLAPDPGVVHQATLTWTPTVGGHRCVRGSIFVAGLRDPLVVGRNLDVIEARAEQDAWLTSFRLGNPQGAAAPIMLRLGGNELADITGAVRLAGREVAPGQPIWLRPGEVVEAELLLRARTDRALDHVRTLEATINGSLVDGIEVIVRRPARFVASDRLELRLEQEAEVGEPAYTYAR